MKRSRLLFILCLFGLGSLHRVDAQDVSNDELARSIVHTSVRVQPGDVVAVAGGKHMIPLMEAVAVEAQLQGGMVTLFLDSDRVTRSFYKNVPEAYLEQEPQHIADWLEDIDVWIGLPNWEDPQAIFADIPEERLAKASRAGQFLVERLNAARLALASIAYPSEEEARMNQVDFPTYAGMHWKAVHADYDAISRQGHALKRLFENARTVRVTTPAGTDFTFAVGDRPIFVDDGIVTPEERKSDRFLDRVASLPGGRVFFAPIETSARGTVVVPKTRCRFEPLTGVAFTFEDGRVQGFKAEQGEACYQETLAAYSGAIDRFGYIGIGLNPALQVMEEGAEYRPENAAGMVWIDIGENQLLGGDNTETGSFSFPLTKATVTIDGRVVVKDGALMPGSL